MRPKPRGEAESGVRLRTTEAASSSWIGGARTGPRRALERWLPAALAVTFIKRRLTAQSIWRADTRRDPRRFEAQLWPQPYPLLSKNARDGGKRRLSAQS